MEANKEYVIWGVPKGKKEETLLVVNHMGEKITSMAKAKFLKAHLESSFGGTNCRIQEIDLSDNKIEMI